MKTTLSEQGTQALLPIESPPGVTVMPFSVRLMRHIGAWSIRHARRCLERKMGPRWDWALSLWLDQLITAEELLQ